VLLTPGPVALGARVREAPTPDLSDREPAFSALFEDVTRKLLAVADLPADRYQALLVGGPGAAAVESCVEALAGLGRLVVLSNGACGERLAAVAAACRPDSTSVLEFNRRTTLDGRTIRKSLRPERLGPQSVLVVHHETSTGMLNSLDELAGLCREHGAHLFVDATASLGAHPLDLQRLGAVLCAGASHVALGGSPGVSFVLGERQFLKRLPQAREAGRTLELATHFKAAVERAQLPYAAPIEAMVRLAAALGELLEHGVAAVHEDLARRAAHVRRGLMGAGLQFPVELAQMSSVSTPVLMPAGVKASALYEALLTRGFVTGKCSAPDEETMLQVGHAGALTASAIDRFLAAVEEELRILALPR
jgi:2-aminoethylphosphonate-pyruvate transaminase